MKEITKEIIKKETWWEASDGTQFNSRAECEKYENTAEFVIRSRYKSLVIKSCKEEDLFINGSCDNIIDIVKLDDSSDINIMLSMCKLYGYSASKEDVCKTAIANDSYILIHRGYDEDNFWIMGTIDEILQDMSNRISSIIKVKFETDYEID